MAYDFNSLTKQAPEASNRDKFYTDFSDVDPNKLHQITELTNWMRTKAKGSDVREIIAQLFERTWLENIKEGNANMEVAQARGSHPNLRSRLDEADKKQRENTAQLAQKANKDEVTNVITPKGTSAYASLPTSGNQVGWYYYCPDGDGVHGAGNYVWNGTSWFFGGTGDEGYNLLKKDLGEYRVKLDTLYKKRLFSIKSGETFVVRSDDGSNMKPLYIRFYNSNGERLGEWSLHDYFTPKRNLTYNLADSFYVTIEGGDAQNIIVEKIDNNLPFYVADTNEKEVYDNALKVSMSELGIKKHFYAKTGDIIVCESINGDEFTVNYLRMFDDGGGLCGNYSLKDYKTYKRFFVFNSSNENNCSKIELSGGTAQDVVVYNLSLTEKEYDYEKLSTLMNDTENSITIGDLYELHSFDVKNGDTISFSSVSGNKMTPNHVRLYSAYGKEIRNFALSGWSVISRTITYSENEPIRYVALTGGTAQDIIVKNISRNIRDVINEQTSAINRNNLQLKSFDVTEKVKEYQSKFSNGMSNESFIFFTDAHTMQHDYVDSVNKSSYQIVNNYLIDLIKNYLDNTSIDFVIDGGDWLQELDSEQDAKLRLGIVSGKCNTLGKCYHLVGNHDTNYQGESTLDNETISNIMFRDFGKTYYSFNGKNTTFYCLDSGLDGRNTLSSFDNEQIDWLCSSLIANPKENIAICMHIWWESETTKSVFANEITNIINAYNNRGTYGSHNFANVSGKVKFVLSGHTHKDLNETLTSGTIVISSINAGYGNNSFDMIYADYSNSKLHCVRVGIGENREFDLLN